MLGRRLRVLVPLAAAALALIGVAPSARAGEWCYNPSPDPLELGTPSAGTYIAMYACRSWSNGKRRRYVQLYIGPRSTSALHCRVVFYDYDFITWPDGGPDYRSCDHVLRGDRWVPIWGGLSPYPDRTWAFLQFRWNSRWVPVGNSTLSRTL